MKFSLAAIALLLSCAAQACLAMQSVTPDRLIACARAALEARSVGLTGELEFIPRTGLPASQVEGEGQVRIEAGGVDGAWPRRRIGVPVQVWMDGQMMQSRMVWFTVHWWQDVPVYARNALAGERANVLATQVVRTDLAGVIDADRAGAPPEMTPALRLRRAVRVGQPVLEGDFEPVPPVARQERVALTVREGPVELRTAATAQGDGEIGERVKVLPDGAGQWVLARVIARNEVAIED